MVCVKLHKREKCHDPEECKLRTVPRRQVGGVERVSRIVLVGSPLRAPGGVRPAVREFSPRQSPSEGKATCRVHVAFLFRPSSQCQLERRLMSP